MNIHVGNLPRETSEGDIRQAFEGHGQVTSVNIIKDKYTGESKGFGFVEMPMKEQAEAAINNLNGKDMGGRSLNISEARPRTESRSTGGGRRW
jgi:RNA recognition motif-containing protein